MQTLWNALRTCNGNFRDLALSFAQANPDAGAKGRLNGGRGGDGGRSGDRDRNVRAGGNSAGADGGGRRSKRGRAGTPGWARAWPCPTRCR